MHWGYFLQIYALFTVTIDYYLEHLHSKAYTIPVVCPQRSNISISFFFFLYANFKQNDYSEKHKHSLLTDIYSEWPKSESNSTMTTGLIRTILHYSHITLLNGQFICCPWSQLHFTLVSHQEAWQRRCCTPLRSALWNRWENGQICLFKPFVCFEMRRQFALLLPLIVPKSYSKV